MHVIMTDQPKDLLIKDEASDSLQFIPYPSELILSSRSLQEAKIWDSHESTNQTLLKLCYMLLR